MTATACSKKDPKPNPLEGTWKVETMQSSEFETNGTLIRDYPPSAPLQKQLLTFTATQLMIDVEGEPLRTFSYKYKGDTYVVDNNDTPRTQTVNNILNVTATEMAYEQNTISAFNGHKVRLRIYTVRQ